MVQYLVKWEKDDKPTWEPGAQLISIESMIVNIDQVFIRASRVESALPQEELSAFAREGASKRQRTEARSDAVSNVRLFIY